MLYNFTLLVKSMYTLTSISTANQELWRPLKEGRCTTRRGFSTSHPKPSLTTSPAGVVPARGLNVWCSTKRIDLPATMLIARWGR